MTIKTSPATKISPILLTEEHTVATEVPVTEEHELTYQTEAQLEAAFIQTLQSQAYEYLPIRNADDLKTDMYWV